MTTPYTYLVRDEFTGQQYYGCRTRKGCHPDELGVSYISSSAVLKKLIADVGLETFTFAVDQIFHTKDEALAYETYVLKSIDAARDPMWINRSNGGKNFCGTPESAAKVAAKMRGRKLTPEHIAKLVAKRLGRKHTPATREKMSVKHRGQGSGTPRQHPNRSGARGVSWYKPRARWHACIRVNKKTRHLGCFQDFAEAVAAAKTSFDERYKELSPTTIRRLRSP